MIELFAGIPPELKRSHQEYIDLILDQYPLPLAAQILSNYATNCQTEIERDFIRFYIALITEEANESNTDQR